MNYFGKAAAAVLLAASALTAGCGQVHVGTLDRERVQEEAPQLKAVVDEANAKLTEAQQEAQAQQGGAEGAQSSKKDDDVVDADFTEVKDK